MRTVSELNSKAWYRLIKVVYIGAFLVAFVAANAITAGAGVKQVDREKTVIICNAQPDISVTRQTYSLDSVDFYISEYAIKNYDYLEFVTYENEVALKIANMCIKKGGGSFHVLDFGPNVKSNPHDFDIYPAYTYASYILRFLIVNSVLLLLFEILRRSFYYITLGSIRPAR